MAETRSTKSIHYLALGDSYTIGEQVDANQNFPNQVATLLKEDVSSVDTRIIAKTGWTTDELEQGILLAQQSGQLLPEYDFVTLLIGVNNQYRGRSVENFETEFEGLLQKAIQFAGNKPERVVILSIPDWGVTPFAEGRDRATIAREIDAYNLVCKTISERYNIYYIYITSWTREAVSDPLMLASDGLHPSGKEYKRWAEKIYNYLKGTL